jgi:hypothetical protein
MTMARRMRHDSNSMPRRALVVLAFAVACDRAPPAPPPASAAGIDAALARAGAFLAAQQADDGAIRSKTYSALKDGWSLTPLAALALRFVPPTDKTTMAYRRAVAFVATVVDDRGAARGPPDVTYPLYAHAIGALVLGAPENRATYAAAHAALLAAVRARQMSDANGWKTTDASYGGWGYSPGIPRRPDGDRIDNDMLTGNLSSTVLAIGALVLGGVPATDPALVAARGFVERCQNADFSGVGTDGGFFFSPALPDANKAGPADAPGRYRSYGSMTADGVRALTRLGAPPDDARLVAAIAWLDRAFDAVKNPGDFPPIAEVRRASSYFYWTWSIAHVARHLNRRAWAEALAIALVARQSADGSWKNPASEMREDDPIVATSFAVAALALARVVITGEARSHAY